LKHTTIMAKPTMRNTIPSLAKGKLSPIQASTIRAKAQSILSPKLPKAPKPTSGGAACPMCGGAA
jgi:hypothetical protein